MISLIPHVLASMIHRIRLSLADGSSVHLSERIAQELMLLDDFPWREESKLQPADLRRWWLIASKVRSKQPLGYIAMVHPDELDRAAACAELALIAQQESAQISRSATTDRIAHLVGPGTNDGAKAVLEFVIRELSGRIMGSIQVRSERAKLLQTYRYDLEAFQ